MLHLLGPVASLRSVPAVGNGLQFVRAPHRARVKIKASALPGSTHMAEGHIGEARPCRESAGQKAF